MIKVVVQTKGTHRFCFSLLTYLNDKNESINVYSFLEQCCARSSVYQNKVLVYYSWLIGFVESTLFWKSEDCANTVLKTNGFLLKYCTYVLTLLT